MKSIEIKDYDIRLYVLLITFLNVIFLFTSLKSQTYNIASVNGQTITTCSGFFTDSNSSGNYSNNENYTVTFCSSSGNPLLFDFSDPINNPPFFDIDCAGDTLYVYNGTSATGTPIAILTNLDDNTQTTYSSQLQIGTTSSCVTFKWRSNASCVDAGWSAAISCISPPTCSGNPPAADIFGQATPICNLNSYCGSTATYYGEDTPFNLIGGGTCPATDDGIFGGTIENNSWLSFQAINTTASFNFTVSNCAGGGIQVGIFGFNGSTFNLVSPCSTTDGSQGGNFTVNATGLTPGNTYYIMIDGNSGANCDYTIMANTGVAVVNAGLDQTICNTTTTLTATAPVSGVGTWSVVSGSGAFANANSPTTTVSGLSLGTNTFKWTIPSGACANVSDLITINVAAGGPTITVTNTTICNGSSTTINASGATTYTWNTGATTSSLSVSPTSTTIYTVTGTSSGCSSSKTLTVTVVSIPTISVNNATICSGGSATLSASGGTSYTWNPGGSTGSNFVVSPASNTTYTVTGSNGTCSQTKTVSVTISGALSINSNSTSICNGNTATLTASGASSYTWLPMNSSGSSVNVSPTTNTTYTIIGLSGACTGSTTVNVNVNPIPTISVNSTTVCAGTTAILQASGATSYTWNTGATTSSISASPSSTTNYTVTGTSIGCSSSKTSTITVISSPTISVNNTTICAGGTATLNATGGTSYTWNPGNSSGSSLIVSPTSNTTYTVISSNGSCSQTKTVSVTISGALSINSNSTSICNGNTATLTASGASSYTWLPMNSSGSSVYVSPTTNTTYTIIGLSGACTGSTTVNVNVNAIPNVSVNSTTICAGVTTILQASGANSYVWEDGTIGSTYTVNANSSSNYAVTGTSNGCSNTATANVIVTQNPTLTVSNDITISNGSSTTLIANSDATDIIWSPSNNLSCTTCTNPLASPSETTEYCVTVKIDNCSVTECVIVKIEIICEQNQNLGVPNAFTPNNDGNNDEFCLKGWEQCVEVFKISIFNRWGEKVFESEDPNFCWDGKYLGLKLDPAVFVYQINALLVGGEKITKKGNITLIK